MMEHYEHKHQSSQRLHQQRSHEQGSGTGACRLRAAPWALCLSLSLSLSIVFSGIYLWLKNEPGVVWNSWAVQFGEDGWDLVGQKGGMWGTHSPASSSPPIHNRHSFTGDSQQPGLPAADTIISLWQSLSLSASHLWLKTTRDDNQSKTFRKKT